MDADGSNPTVLTNLDSMRPPTEHIASATQPDWSPDGKQIMFSAYFIWQKWDFYSVKPDGSSLVNLSNTPDIQERRPNWKP